jgi:arylsulfatase A-like enzyme
MIRAHLLGVALVAGLLVPSREAADERPNVVFLLWADRTLDDVDDPGHLPAPHLDQLMRAGRRLQAHVPTSRGRPARTLLLNGRWPHESGLYFNEGPRNLPPGNTLSLALKGAGYAPAVIGGWHEGDAGPFGFDERLPAEGSDLQKELERLSHEHANQPLLLWWAPEIETQRGALEVDPEPGDPPAWFDDEEGDWGRFVARRRQSTAQLDQRLGQLLSGLEAAGRLENTLFVLVSDQPDRRLTSACVSERLLTTPLVFTWKGHLEPGRVPGLVSALDLPTTMLDLLDVEPPEGLPGTSFGPLVLGTVKEPEPVTLRGALYDRRVSPASKAGKLPHKDVKVLYSRGPRWKYVLYVQDVGRRGTGNREIHVERAAGTEELYDLESDPHEQHDLAGELENAELCGRLREALLDWWTATGGGELTLPYSVSLGPPPEGRPNIVLILSDDQDYEHLGFMGNPDVRTPTLDALAEAGVVYPVAHVTMSRCRPSLASLLSGLYPHQHGLYDNESAGLLARQGSLPNQLKKAGYATFCAGKYWEGSYDSMGFLGSVASETFVRSDHQEDLFAFVDRYRDERPFFVWYAPLLPHGPFNPPEHLRKEFEDTPVAMRPGVTSSPEAFTEAERTSYAMEAWLDEGVHDFVQHLEEVGELEDTLFLFLIDNGWANGSPAKGSVFEKGLRTPIFVTWPRGIAGGRRLPTLLSSLDLYATILDYAGAGIPKNTQGRSLRPQLEGRSDGPDREVLHGAVYDSVDTRRKAAPEQHVYALYARTARYKFVLYLRDVVDTGEFVIWHEHAAFPTRKRGDRNLYDLEADPYERNDLSGDPRHQETMDRLLEGCLKWWKDTGGGPLNLPE